MARRFLLLVFAVFALLAPAVAEAQFRLGRKPVDERLKGAERRRFDVLELILEEAEGAADRAGRERLLREYLELSDGFVRDHPDSLTVWTGRVHAAVELNRARVAWTAGQSLLRLGAENSDDAKVRRALAMLERRGWLGQVAPALGPRGDELWENSLGMRFVAIDGADVVFCVWETRVRDFAAFTEARRYDAMADMLTFDLAESGWAPRGGSWRLPGFEQSEDHPVVGVNWHDAKAFCDWLTERERQDGLIAEDQAYRLPTDAEWSLAVGSGRFPWGERWSPPSGAGNFLGEENAPSALRVLEGYADGFRRTAPVERFAPNRFGLYDMAGNVEEWCDDVLAASEDGASQRIVRGASWSYQNPANLESQRRRRIEAGLRIDDVGFRCVLVTRGAAAAATVSASPGTAATPSAAAAVSAGAPGALTPPRPIHRVEPDPPQTGRTSEGDVSVVVEMLVDEQGMVREPRIVQSSDPAFDGPTLAAVLDWRFVAARRDGQAVACRVSQEFVFRTVAVGPPNTRRERGGDSR